jgi:DNA-binding NtrC family response regulator
MNEEKSSTYDLQAAKPSPLKERKGDILEAARRFIKEAGDQLGTGNKSFSKEAEEFLLNYDWQGDESELETTIKRACVLSEEEVLQVEDFDLKKRQIKSVGKFIEGRLKGFMRNIKTLERFNLYDMVIPEVEKALILMVMRETKGNQVRAAKLLGINRNTLRSKIKRLGISAKH